MADAGRGTRRVVKRAKKHAARQWMVRRLTAPWAERCAAVSARAIDETWPENERLGVVGERLRRPEVWKQFFAERTVFGVCDEAGALLGVATLHRAGDTAYLGAHSVLYRGRGIGAALTVARLAEARSWGCKQVVALIAPYNAASAANLTAQGFVCVSSDPDGTLRYRRLV
jgi:RimJ/RimL family protein N-acetyltransferase